MRLSSFTLSITGFLVAFVVTPRVFNLTTARVISMKEILLISSLVCSCCFFLSLLLQSHSKKEVPNERQTKTTGDKQRNTKRQG